MMKSNKARRWPRGDTGEMPVAAPADRQRFEAPIYTIGKAAWLLDVKEQTLRNWTVDQPGGGPLVTAYPTAGRFQPVIPFVGFAEGFVVAAFRQHSKMPMGYLRAVLAEVERLLGVQHALASNVLASHGKAVLLDISKDDSEVSEWVEVLTKNQVFDKVVEGHLKRITYHQDGWAQRVALPMTERKIVVVDPRKAFGQPIFKASGARLVDVLDRWNAGDHPTAIADDFAVPEADVLDVLRALTEKARQAA